MVKWRILNSDRVEVSPEDREHAWKDLIIDVLKQCPRYNSYRTMINKANFENFDYKQPIVYEMSNEQLLINNEFLNKTLNRPFVIVSPINMRVAHVMFLFICSVLLIVVANFFTYNKEEVNKMIIESNAVV
ncbi:pif6 [Lambdina fiscellaria nucleopolyhedrovirus]|uniref:Pif6 n=1 Tax=Lambdina fiscellaria nucleopolyhedrovirus TaxID=1642929 RepID=A0A0E3URR3_9ABAC|nr:pif6 [Lambdina fiscellaria nucleopolyhedrovirus]AKC91699.1 pif6 [Lambdina fiscellaria nucleopolyhedrovirus]